MGRRRSKSVRDARRRTRKILSTAHVAVRRSIPPPSFAQPEYDPETDTGISVAEFAKTLESINEKLPEWIGTLQEVIRSSTQTLMQQILGGYKLDELDEPPIIHRF